MARWSPVLDIYAGLWVSLWARYALAQGWHDCERLGASRDATQQSEPTDSAPAGESQATLPARSTAEVDARVLRATFRDAYHEVITQLRAAGAEIERAGTGVRGAMQAMTAVLPDMVECCGGVPGAHGSIQRVVIAAQFEDINDQVLAHAVLRLRAVETLVDGLAPLAESVLEVLEAASPDGADLGGIGVRLHQAVALAQALRAPCALVPPTGGGSVDLF